MRWLLARTVYFFACELGSHFESRDLANWDPPRFFLVFWVGKARADAAVGSAGSVCSPKGLEPENPLPGAP